MMTAKKKSRHPFPIKANERAGIKRAAEWHDYVEGIFRGAVRSRQQVGLNFGEMLMKAEDHETHARELRQILKESP